MAIEEKWTKRWQESKLFEAEPKKDQKKFFGTFPYPYVNSYLHVGHFYSSMILEAISRYKRMDGFNVLYSQGWHCTGSPIVNAAKRIKEGEPIQVSILKKLGFDDAKIKEFADPKKWIEFFPIEAKKDMTEMGYSVDWRRQFITTELNPHYDKFIRWQFAKLKEKGYVLKGKFPVVWDPVENEPVGDHARSEGEGETPQEYVLVKHKLPDGTYIVSATLRPDTIMGVTNLYVNPKSMLALAKVDGEKWIISKKTAHELAYQDKKVDVLEEISGESLIGNIVKEFSGNEVMVLPATFVSTDVGTGIVHSVPSDSADDLIALYDLQKDEAMCKKFGLLPEDVKKIMPIAVITIPGYGNIPADDVIKRLGIKNQDEKDKLKKAKELLYKDGYYKGRLNSLYSKKFSENLEGKKVDEVKDQIKDELIASEFGDRYYRLTGKVVSRSLAECLVKIVDDQWFLAYGDEVWKKQAHRCLDQMRLYPEKTRSQFDYVLDWLRNWACTREFGLGTKLPWDEKWLIESLSDSTIYMSYYTIAHKIKEIDPEKLDNAFFDYVLLGKGDPAKLKLDKNTAESMRQEFEYWYPMDFRNTGKDLIQNHMSFCIFNHVAIFPEKHWPKSYGLNGHILVNGEKMSKSKGNFITMREAFRDYGADAARFAVLSGGEGIDDANFDTELAKSMQSKLQYLLEFASQYYGKGRNEKLAIDEWLEQQIDNSIIETTKNYENVMLRSAIQSSYFNLQNALKWYLRRCMNNPNKETISRFIEVQALLIAPVSPFIAEEIWETIGKKGFISVARWPKPERKTKEDKTEDMVRSTLEDIYSVLKLAGVQSPKKIKLFISPSWKYDLYSEIAGQLEDTRDFGKVMGNIMKIEKFKEHSKEISRIIQKAIKSGIDEPSTQEKEFRALKESSAFLEDEFKAEVEVMKAEDSKEEKSGQASPGKPAILVE